MGRVEGGTGSSSDNKKGDHHPQNTEYPAGLRASACDRGVFGGRRKEKKGKTGQHQRNVGTRKGSLGLGQRKGGSFNGWRGGKGGREGEGQT